MSSDLVFYLLIDYPTPKVFFETVDELVRRGVDTIEFGIPSPNPFLDGPTIAQSHAFVLSQGFCKARYIQVMDELKVRYPYLRRIVMAYGDAIEEYALLEEPSRYEGLILPDLVIEDHPKTIQLFHEKLNDDEIEHRLKHCDVFAYVMSSLGQTGSVDRGREYPSTIARIRRSSEIEINVGFGLRSKTDIDEVHSHQVGAIIGSELTKKIIDRETLLAYLDEVIHPDKASRIVE